MKLKKIISGGQTGADRTALECAKQLGIETGGWAPKGWRIDGGTDPSLAEFGCIEHPSDKYPPRTAANVRDSDCTVWFGKISPGYKCTINACNSLGKLLFPNPTPAGFKDICRDYEVVNVAGNRARLNPEVVGQVIAAFGALTND